MSLAPVDQLALVDLVHRYAAAVDDQDPRGAAALFTTDGVLATPRPPKHLDPVDEVVGAVMIESTMRQLSGTTATQHAVVGVVLDAHGSDSAAGRIACMAHHVLLDGRDLVWHLTYRDRYQRTEAGWRFGSRHLHVEFVEQRPVISARGLSGEGQ